MPNCDFYATRGDHVELLDWLFADDACEVHELDSEFDRPLRRFHGAAEVVAEFDRAHRGGKPRATVHLHLFVKDSGPPLVPRRIVLVPGAVPGHTHRFTSEGWGLIQLYLSTTCEGSLGVSHTNHGSLERARRWEGISLLGPADAWDFDGVKRFSSRLNRQIRSRAVAKSGSRVLLPGAFAASQAGVQVGAPGIAIAPR